MANDGQQSPVSATELAQALIKALQQNTARSGVIRGIVAEGSDAQKAITQYEDIADDLETLSFTPKLK